jgi:hypothetical protein
LVENAREIEGTTKIDKESKEVPENSQQEKYDTRHTIWLQEAIHKVIKWMQTIR